MEEISFPLAPLAEQRRIVARIDALFAEIAEGEAALKEARKGLEVFRRALLKAAVTGELTKDWRAANPPTETGPQLLTRLPKQHNSKRSPPRGKDRLASGTRQSPDLPGLPQAWTWATLSALGTYGRGRSRHRPRDDKRLYGDLMPFVQTGVVAQSSDYILGWEQSYSAFGVQQSRVWPSGTLCITIAANIADTAITTFDCCFPDSVVGLHPVPEIEPLWVLSWMKTIQRRLDRFAPATAQKNINLQILDQVRVPLPPESEIKEIVARLREATSALAEVVALLDAQAADGRRLKQSILKAAFEGRLLPQDPTDEPASALLDRLRAEPAANRPRSRKRR